MEENWPLKQGSKHKYRYKYKHRKHNSGEEKVGEEPIKYTLNHRSREAFGLGPKFVIKPKKPPVGEYIVAVEQACSRLSQGEADEL